MTQQQTPRKASTPAKAAKAAMPAAATTPNTASKPAANPKPARKQIVLTKSQATSTFQLSGKALLLCIKEWKSWTAKQRAKKLKRKNPWP